MEALDPRGQFVILFVVPPGEEEEEPGWHTAELDLFNTIEDALAWILDYGGLEIAYAVAQIVVMREVKKSGY